MSLDYSLWKSWPELQDPQPNTKHSNALRKHLWPCDPSGCSHAVGFLKTLFKDVLHMSSGQKGGKPHPIKETIGPETGYYIISLKAIKFLHDGRKRCLLSTLKHAQKMQFVFFGFCFYVSTWFGFLSFPKIEPWIISSVRGPNPLPGLRMHTCTLPHSHTPT